MKKLTEEMFEDFKKSIYDLLNKKEENFKLELKEVVDRLSLKITLLNNQIFELQNPFKFNVGDDVILNNIEGYNINNNNFKIIEKNWEKSFYGNYIKMYKLFNCVDNKLISCEEGRIIIKNFKGK